MHSVICTVLHKHGFISDATYVADARYGQTLPICVMQGYWAWGTPAARWLDKHPKSMLYLYSMARPVIQELAHRGGHGTGNWFGRMAFYLGYPVCGTIGLGLRIYDFFKK